LRINIMNIRKLTISAALAASLLIPAGIMLAQDDTATSETPAEQDFWGPRGGKGMGGHHGWGGRGGEMRGLRMGGEWLDLAQEYTGLNPEEIRDGLIGGQTLAELIEANDASVEDFITAAVEQASARIDEALANGAITEARAEELKANLSDWVTAWVNGETPMGDGLGFGGRHDGGPGFGRGMGGGFGLRGEFADLVEEYTGLAADEIRDAHMDGRTLAELIEANDASVDEFVAAVTEQASARIDEALANGAITEARAEELKANLSDWVTAWVNGEHPMWDGRGPVAPETNATAEPNV
jgi:ribosomal protein S20